MTEKLDQLRSYTERGWRIFPCWEIGPEGICSCSSGASCSSPGKHPRVPSWTSLATTDIVQVEEWHRAWPSANWAWALTDHWVLDFDPRNGGDEPYDYWEAWAGFEMPATLIQWTGGGGHHVVFVQPVGGPEIRNGKLTFPNQTRPAPGVDVKGIGGYIMLAQSNHISGQQYRWANWPVKPTLTPAEFIELKMLERRGSSGGGGDGAYDLMALLSTGVPIGEQNEQLFRFMCALRTKSFSREDMVALAMVAVSKMPQDPAWPWDQDKIVEMVDRVRERYAPGYSSDFDIPQVDDQALAWAMGKIPDDVREKANEYRVDEDETFEVDVTKRVRGMFVTDEARTRFNTIKASKTFQNPRDDPESTSLAALLEMPPRNDKQLVDGLLSVEHNCVIAAAYKTGKTTLAANLVGSLVDGKPFLGKFPTHLPEDECVLHLNGEMSRDDLVAYYRGLGIKNVDRIKVMNYRDKSLPLLDDAVLEMFLEYCMDNWVTVVIVDSWRRLCAWSGLEENRNDQIERLTSRIDEFKRKAEAPTFIAIAHQGRKQHEEGEEHARGATALDDWADARWILSKGKELDEQRYLRVVGRGVELDETALVFDSDTHQLSLGAGGRSDNASTVGFDQIVEIVEARPGITKRELAEALRDTGIIKGGGPSFKAIDRCVQKGLIHTVPGPNRSHLHYPGPDPAKAGAAAWAASKTPNWQ